MVLPECPPLLLPPCLAGVAGRRPGVPHQAKGPPQEELHPQQRAALGAGASPRSREAAREPGLAGRGQPGGVRATARPHRRRPRPPLRPLPAEPGAGPASVRNPPAALGAEDKGQHGPCSRSPSVSGELGGFGRSRLRLPLLSAPAERCAMDACIVRRPGAARRTLDPIFSHLIAV